MRAAECLALRNRCRNKHWSPSMTNLLDLFRAIQGVSALTNSLMTCCRNTKSTASARALNPRTYRERARHYGVTATNN